MLSVVIVGCIFKQIFVSIICYCQSRLTETTGVYHKPLVSEKNMLAMKTGGLQEIYSLKCCLEYSHTFLSSRSYIYLKEDELLVVWKIMVRVLESISPNSLWFQMLFVTFSPYCYLSKACVLTSSYPLRKLWNDQQGGKFYHSDTTGQIFFFPNSLNDSCLGVCNTFVWVPDTAILNPHLTQPPGSSDQPESCSAVIHMAAYGASLVLFLSLFMCLDLAMASALPFRYSTPSHSFSLSLWLYKHSSAPSLLNHPSSVFNLVR